MGNTETKPKTPILTANPNEKVNEKETNGYANGLRPESMGTMPPSVKKCSTNSVMPQFLLGRDELERSRECYRYEKDMDKYNRSQEDFSKCINVHEGKVLYGSKLFSKDYMPGAHNRSVYSNESTILEHQVNARNKSLENTRNGSMYDGSQKNVQGKNALARRPVASIGVENSIHQGKNNFSLKPTNNKTNLVFAANQKRQELESNKFGEENE